MSDHRMRRIDFKRPSRYVAVCACGWRSEPVLAAGLAGSLWDRHANTAPAEPTEGPILDVDLALGEAARELYGSVIPTLKDAARAGHPLTATASFGRMEQLAALLGDREERLARAIRRQWDLLVDSTNSRQRATVIVGLVELGERAREHLSSGLPQAPAHESV